MEFWPNSAEGWSTLAANLVTVVGAIALTIIVRVNLRLLVYWQRRAVQTAELQASAVKSHGEGVRPSDATKVILSTILTWSNAHDRYKDGIPFDEYSRLNGRQRREYALWVARLLSAFDLVLLDVAASKSREVQATLKAEIAKHASLLEKYRFAEHRYAMSPLLTALVQEALSGR